ncbi:MAG: glutathione S-transferase family protein [Kofleriaceae bacterium]|nr:glutathione S-transferase family protein [Kofleriaceae bacterium]
MSGAKTMSGGEFVMYGAEFSLYSGKLRSYLYKKGIPFREVRPWAMTYKRFIVPRTGVSYIPVLQSPDDEVWQDTSVIIDTLESLFPDNPMIPKTPRRRLASLILELFGDEWLLNVAMHYRWNVPENDLQDLFVDFGKIVLPWGPRVLHRKLGRSLASRFKKFVPRLGVTTETTPALELWYEKFLVDLETHFGTHDYLLGAHPTIADFGFIGPFYAHLYRDPVPGHYLRAHAPQVVKWIERMMAPDSVVVKASSDDEIPTTLLPILQSFSSEQLPVLRDTAAVFDRWARSQSEGASIPRHLGTHAVRMAGVDTDRSVLPYSLWMMQRVVDYRCSSEQSERDEIDAFLLTIDADLSTWQQSTRIERRDNRLWIAPK